MSFGDLVPVREYSADNAYEQMKADAVERRKRLYARAVIDVPLPRKEPPPVVKLLPPLPIPPPVLPKPVEIIRSKPITFVRIWTTGSMHLGPAAWPTPEIIVRKSGATIAREIIDHTCFVFQVSRLDLLSHRRNRHLANARHAAFWTCKAFTMLSLPNIARFFDGRDHTTIMHGIRKIQALIDRDNIAPDANTPEGWLIALREVLECNR